jgi:micrococcal nuclease
MRDLAMKVATLTPIFLSLALAPELAYALPSILSVGDGDTVSIIENNRPEVIRLACIDAPEKAQAPWGKESSNRLKQLLTIGQVVQVRAVEKDKYGRTVAELFLGGRSINLQMIMEGQAVVYRKYLSSCNDRQQEYLNAEAIAKQQKLGFWSQVNPQMPWDFRHGSQIAKQPIKKEIQPAQMKPSVTQQSGNCSPAYPGVCIPPAPPDLNCKDIPFRRFQVLPPDPHHFDGDRDGIGCEK